MTWIMNKSLNSHVLDINVLLIWNTVRGVFIPALFNVEIVNMGLQIGIN